MELKEGLLVKLKNLPGVSPWEGVLCKVEKVEEHMAKLVPVKAGIPKDYDWITPQSLAKYGKIIPRSLENK